MAWGHGLGGGLRETEGPGRRSKGHDGACVLLATARALLSSGLADVLASVPPAPDHIALVRLMTVAVMSQEEHVRSVIGRFSSSAALQWDDLPPTRSVQIHWSSWQLETSALYRCAIQSSELGRCVVASHGISEQTVVLRDAPFCFAPNSACGCREESLLTEHVRLASAVTASCAQHPNLFRQFLASTFSGLRAGAHPDGVGVWSPSMQRLMACVSVLHALAQSGDPEGRTESGESRERVVQTAALFFETLARLPANTHGVTVVREAPASSSSSAQPVLLPQQLGVALFPRASAVNHSCRPNAAVRYARQGAQLTIEVVSTRALQRGEEILISYGPLAPVHSLASRRRTLRVQYLFVCACQACTADQQRVGREVAGQGWDDGATGVVERTKELCRALARVRRALPDLDAQVCAAVEQYGGGGAVDGGASVHALLGAVERLECECDGLLRTHFPRLHGHVMSGAAATAEDGEAGDEVFIEGCALYCVCLDLAARLFAAATNFEVAAGKVRRAVRVMVGAGLYGERDIVVARERAKAAGLLANGGDVAGAAAEASDALPVLVAQADASDPDLAACQQILRFAATAARVPWEARGRR